LALVAWLGAGPRRLRLFMRSAPFATPILFYRTDAVLAGFGRDRLHLISVNDVDHHRVVWAFLVIADLVSYRGIQHLLVR